MAHRKGTLPPADHRDPLAFRPVEFHAAEEGEAERSVKVTLATGEGVDVYDWQRGMLKEYLAMDGAKIPKQVPLVDSHNHGSVRNVLGSIRDIEVKSGKLTGRSYFGSKPAASEAYQDVREGHITDISVGFFRLKEHYIETDKEGEVNGKRVKGPARIVTRWQPFEGSAVTVGADRHSTFGSVPALRAYFDPTGLQEETMNENYRKLLVSLGMDANLDDDAALAWATDNLAKREADKPPTKITEAGPAELAAAQLAAAKAERSRVSGILADCRKYGVVDEEAARWVDEGLSRDVVSTRILEAQTAGRTKPLGSSRIETVKGHLDGFRAAVLDGVAQRIGAPVEKPAAGANEFRGMRILDLARKSLTEEGHNVKLLDDREVARRAFSIGEGGARASDGQAYLTTGNFSNLLLDASNKTLLKSFMDVPTTYQLWARQGESVPDFKLINRIRLGELGNQPHVEENGDYKDLSLSDAKEAYRVEKRGSLVSLTWEAMRNDDLGGFNRIVQLQGSSMKRTINRSVYQILFDNPTLSDGVAIFHSSSHGANLVTSAFTVAVLNTAYSAMALQTGIDSNTILGVVPRYVIHAPGITGTVWSILNSLADPAAGGSAVGNSGNANIYGPRGGRSLLAIEEPLLAGNDADSWYLAADSNQVDTIEYTFLSGEESPVFEQETAFIQDAVKYKIRQTWGVKCIDYRGLYKSTG